MRKLVYATDADEFFYPAKLRISVQRIVRVDLDELWVKLLVEKVHESHDPKNQILTCLCGVVDIRLTYLKNC